MYPLNHLRSQRVYPLLQHSIILSWIVARPGYPPILPMRRRRERPSLADKASSKTITLLLSPSRYMQKTCLLKNPAQNSWWLSRDNAEGDRALTPCASSWSATSRVGVLARPATYFTYYNLLNRHKHHVSIAAWVCQFRKSPVYFHCSLIPDRNLITSASLLCTETCLVPANVQFFDAANTCSTFFVCSLYELMSFGRLQHILDLHY